MPITVNSDPVDEVIVSCGRRGQSFHIFMLPLCASVHSDTHTHTRMAVAISTSHMSRQAVIIPLQLSTPAHWCIQVQCWYALLCMALSHAKWYQSGSRSVAAQKDLGRWG